LTQTEEKKAMQPENVSAWQGMSRVPATARGKKWILPCCSGGSATILLQWSSETDDSWSLELGESKFLALNQEVCGHFLQKF
jgi:hypothetical protein